MSKSYKHKHYLALLGQAKNRNRRNKIIDVADKEELTAICDCIHNVLKGNVKLKNNQIMQLRKYKKHLRSLTNKRMSVKKRKDTLKQHGGFLPLLIPAAVSILSRLIGISK